MIDITDEGAKRLLEAIFAENPLADFNDLVREAYSAQEAFDNWDEGKTWDAGSKFTKQPRMCALDDLCTEWDAANIKLINFVLEHGQEIMTRIAEDAMDKSEGSA